MHKYDHLSYWELRGFIDQVRQLQEQVMRLEERVSDKSQEADEIKEALEEAGGALFDLLCISCVSAAIAE